MPPSFAQGGLKFNVDKFRKIEGNERIVTKWGNNSEFNDDFAN